MTVMIGIDPHKADPIFRWATLLFEGIVASVDGHGKNLRS